MDAEAAEWGKEWKWSWMKLDGNEKRGELRGKRFNKKKKMNKRNWMKEEAKYLGNKNGRIESRKIWTM